MSGNDNWVHPSRANPNIVPRAQLNVPTKRKAEPAQSWQEKKNAKKAKQAAWRDSVAPIVASPVAAPAPLAGAPQYESKEARRAAKIARRAAQRNLELGIVEDVHAPADLIAAPQPVAPPIPATPVVEQKPKEKKPPKREKKKSKAREPEPEKDDEEVDNRHKAVLQKREKSLKKAQKIKKLEETLKTAQDEDVEMKDAELPPAELHALEPLPQPEPAPEGSKVSIYSVLPSWLGEPIRVPPSATAEFTDLGLEKHAIDSLAKAGFNNAFAVQSAVLPLLLPGAKQQDGDVLVSAATGSGKTLSYVLPMVDDISKTKIPRLQGLIVMPTRELVAQAREVCDICINAFTFGKRRHINVGTAIGNQVLKAEQAALMKHEFVYDPVEYRAREARVNSYWSPDAAKVGGNPNLFEDHDDDAPRDHIIRHSPKVDILICTPGRLVEHMKLTPGFNLNELKWLIIDEADKLLDQSFQQWLPTVITALAEREKTLSQTHSARQKVRKVVLSATMTRDIGLLTDLKLHEPKFVALEGSEEGEDAESRNVSLVIPDKLRETTVMVDDEGLKPLYLLEVLKRNGLLTPPGSTKGEDSDSDSDSDSSSDEDSDDSSDSDSDNESSSDDSSDSSDDDSGSESDSSASSSASSTSSASSKPAKATKKVVKNISTQPSQPPPDAPSRGVLIFTKSTESALRLSRLLSLLIPSLYPASKSLASQIGTLTSSSSSSRKSILRRFRTSRLSILVASDLVARGLDIPQLHMVVNYDIPASVASYVHRVGRTARAGREGLACTLVERREGRWFWGEIARNGGLRRQSKVERVVVDARTMWDEEVKAKYEEALGELGREAVSGKK
jgi:ATP-dependent RNA helicase DDX51/DBP6